MIRHFIQWLRSLAFIVQMYLFMAVLALAVTPFALFDIGIAHWGVRFYSRWVRMSAAALAGLRSEIRGEIPSGRVLIAAKHHSFFDILMLCSVLDRPRFVMKREILILPIVGYYARRIGCIAIDRGKGSVAVKQLLDGAQGSASRNPLIIYPQGTRVQPGEWKRYRAGAGILHAELGMACVPAATNVGLFWPRAAIMRRPGLAVMEFLPKIEPGLSQDAMLRELETRIEENSNRLMREAGHPPAS